MITEAGPDLIINCVVSGVDACEANPSMASAVNVVGPQYLAEAAAEIDAEILHFSTNYVFDGKREAGSFYTNRDAPLPINKYGETKLAGELAVLTAAPKSYTVHARLPERTHSMNSRRRLRLGKSHSDGRRGFHLFL